MTNFDSRFVNDKDITSKINHLFYTRTSNALLVVMLVFHNHFVLPMNFLLAQAVKRPKLKKNDGVVEKKMNFGTRMQKMRIN